MSKGLAPRQVAHEILVRAETTAAFADVLLAERLNGAHLDERDAALATRLVYGTLAWQARLDHHLTPALRLPLARLDPEVRGALRLGAFQLLFLERVPAFAAIDTSVEVLRRAGGRRAVGLVNAVLRRVAATGPGGVPLPDAVRDPIARLAVEWSHPAWLIAQWEKDIDAAELPALLAANNEAGPVTIRVNPLRTTPVALAASLRAEGFDTEPGRWAPMALSVSRQAARLREHRTYRDGLFAFQGEASQIVAQMLAVRSGGRILDACAAPGGKAQAIGERVNELPIVALDAHATGLRRLREGAHRLGLPGVHAVVADARRPPLRGGFAAVLVDAPCSGLGTLRRHPELRWRRTPADLERLGRLQGEILDGIAPLVEPGGMIVYAVCTISRAENEDVVACFLSQHTEFDVEPASESLPEPARALVDSAGFLRTLPHRHGLDGFFAARLRRRRLDSIGTVR